MTSLPDKNVPLTQLTIPGTHDSFCSENKIEPGIASFNTSFAACQHDSFTTEDQLKAGIRLLDFRVEFDGKLSHGVARLRGNLYDQIRIVANFLEANPGEAVLVSVKWEYESVQKKDGFNLNFEVRGTPEPDGEAGRIIQRLREVPGAKWWMERKFPSIYLNPLRSTDIRSFSNCPNPSSSSRQNGIAHALSGFRQRGHPL